MTDLSSLKQKAVLSLQTADTVTSIASRLVELDITLPPACAPAATYLLVIPDGDKLIVAGHTPDDRGPEYLVKGRVGEDVTVEQAYEAARSIGVAILGAVNQFLEGDLDRIDRLMEASGVVACTQDFELPHKVINGFSDLMREVLGNERGIAVRSAIGVMALPGGVCVEITRAVLRIKPKSFPVRPLSSL